MKAAFSSARVLRGGRLARWGARLLALAMLLRDARTPRRAKLVAFGVIAYALSPVDLIPDFVPLLGLLDDLVIVPMGIALIVHLLPAGLWADVLGRAQARADRVPGLLRWIVVGVVAAIVLWIGALVLFGAWLLHAFSGAG